MKDISSVLDQFEALAVAIAELEGVKPWEAEAARGALDAAKDLFLTRSVESFADDLAEVAKAALDAKKFGGG